MTKRKTPPARYELIKHLPWRDRLSYVRLLMWFAQGPDSATAVLSWSLASTALFLFSLIPGHAAQQQTSAPSHSANSAASLAYPGENHLANIRQLTFGGQSAEAYFSADDKYLIFQHQGQFYYARTHAPTGPNVPCDQMYTMPVPASGQSPAMPTRISNGQGRTTCGYFFP